MWAVWSISSHKPYETIEIRNITKTTISSSGTIKPFQSSALPLGLFCIRCFTPGNIQITNTTATIPSNIASQFSIHTLPVSIKIV